MSDCDVWTGYTNPKGDGPGPRVYVHRHAWEQVHGPIPAGLTIDHLCCNTSCVNVEHMEVVTFAENTRRALARRLAAGLCSNGHPRPATGSCLVCVRANVAASRSSRSRVTAAP